MSKQSKQAWLILDFVTRIVPDQDESIILLGKNAKLSIVYGFK